VVDDLDEATPRSSARRSQGGPGTTRELEGFSWRGMADLEGNELDIAVLPPEAA
jgi:hypothetical protein